MEKIIQIIPGSGWMAEYDQGELEQNWLGPVVCFALTEDENGDRYVRGMDAPVNDALIDFCDNCNNFIGYKKL